MYLIKQKFALLLDILKYLFMWNNFRFIEHLQRE